MGGASYRSWVGQTLGRLSVEEYLPRCRKTGELARFKCKCDCGNEVIVNASNLLRKNKGTRSCGCLVSETSSKNQTTHGKSKSSEWLAWRNMKTRCCDVNHKAYLRYGGRGIKVCERWLDSFENFFEDMGEKPSPRHTLERKNNSEGYEPGNCVWATRKAQSRNTRRCRMITCNGVTKTLMQWSEETGIKYTTLQRRLGRWSVEKALGFGI